MISKSPSIESLWMFARPNRLSRSMSAILLACMLYTVVPPEMQALYSYSRSKPDFTYRSEPHDVVREESSWTPKILQTGSEKFFFCNFFSKRKHKFLV